MKQKEVDVEKLAKEFYKKTHSYFNLITQNDIDMFKGGYNQALQSNDKMFSLEDMKLAFDAGSISGSSNWDSYLRPNIEDDKNKFIQSLTKEQETKK